MKKSGVILGITGSTVAVICSGLSVWLMLSSVPTPGMGSTMETYYLISNIFSILSVPGAAAGILGTVIVLKKPVAGGVLMLSGAFGSALSGFGIIASVLFLIGGIFAIVGKGKPAAEAAQLPEKNDDAGHLALGITLGAFLLIVSSIIVSLAYFSEFGMSPDAPQYGEYMKKLVTLTPYDTKYIVLGAAGMLGGLAGFIFSSIVKTEPRCSGRRLGFIGSSLALFTVVWVLTNGRVLFTYPEVTALAYTAATGPCTILGFLGSALIKRNNILSGILLIIAAAGLLIELSVQTMVFIVAAFVLLLLGGIFALIPEKKPEPEKEETV